VLQALRLRLRNTLHLATTWDYSRRFLHSTGQFHQGRPTIGLFLQLTAGDVHDAPYTFGLFRRAQAWGDLEVLRHRGRRVVRVHLAPTSAKDWQPGERWWKPPWQKGNKGVHCMNASQYILLAVDDSEVTARAVTYVASIIEGQPGFRLCLWHGFAPLPPKLLEFAGAENPAEDASREMDRREAQVQWLASAKSSAQHLFAKAQAILRTAGIPDQAVGTELATSLSGEDVVTSILEAARPNQCGAVVVGRDSFSWLAEGTLPTPCG
jgi:nucleotide-binding universal stress UspA family protein